MAKWAARFMRIALEVADWSKDESTKVGAVIADHKRWVSLGFNGPPEGVPDEFDSRDQKLMRTIHAEVNAALTANRSVAGLTLYSTTQPCANCVAVLIQLRIGSIVFLKTPDDVVDRWRDSFLEGQRMCKAAGVGLYCMSLDANREVSSFYNVNMENLASRVPLEAHIADFRRGEYRRRLQRI